MLALVSTESPRNPDRQVTWFGLRNVFGEASPVEIEHRPSWAGTAFAWTGAERPGGLDQRLRGLPNLSPRRHRPGWRPVPRVLVRVATITVRNLLPSDALHAGGEVSTSVAGHDATFLRKARAHRDGGGRDGSSREPDRRAEGSLQVSKAGARCDPGAQPPAGSSAGPPARSSSGGSSPVVRPAHARRGGAE